MPAIPAISGVDSRIAAIRARIGGLTAGSAGANLSVDLDGRSDRTEGFDPFGSVYQLALERAGITSSSQSGGFTSGAASSPETYSSGSSGSSSSGGAVRVTAVGASGVRPTSAAAASAAPSSSNGSLAGEQIAELAYNAGFRGQDLVNVVAISKRESNWQPSAFNGNASTGDLSYGLMQINMKGSLGPARLHQLGLSTNDQLLDPQTNMNAAFKIYSDSGNSLNAWGGYKGQSNTYSTDIAAAQQVVANAQLENGL